LIIFKEHYVPAQCFCFRCKYVSAANSVVRASSRRFSLASDAEIHKILVDRIGSENTGIGIVVGVIDAKGQRVVAYGSLAKDDKRTLNGDTVFENHGHGTYLPASVKVPERNGKKIALQDTPKMRRILTSTTRWNSRMNLYRVTNWRVTSARSMGIPLWEPVCSGTRSVTFESVGPDGLDVYEVKFENGSTEWKILLDSDRKAVALGFRPL
jgi:hypothetical protein